MNGLTSQFLPTVSSPPAETDGARRILAREPAARARLQKLMEPNGAMTLALLALEWSAVVAAVLISEWAQHWAVYILAAWFIGGRMVSLAEVLGHDSVHYNLFRRRSLNQSLEFLWFTPIFESWSSYREAHNRHHAFLLKENDPAIQDYERWGLHAGPQNSVWIWFVRPLLCFDTLYLLRQIVSGLVEDRAYRLRIALFWLPVLALAAWAGGLELLLYYWFIPLLWCYPALVFWSETGEHFNVKQGQTRNTFGWVEFLFVSPQNDRYHAVHHRFPRIPGFRLARAYRELDLSRDVEESHGFMDLYRRVRGGLKG